jgi:uncharacterized protein (TIRG00374 family)
VRKIKAFSKRYLGLAYVLVVAFVIVAWALHTGELPIVIKQLSGLDGYWLLFSAGLLIGYVLLRAQTLHVYLKSEATPLTFGKCLAVTGIGQFYSAITPSSSGGQPLEVFSMARWGVPGPVATAAVSVQFICFQVALVVLGAGLWIFTRTHVALYLGGLVWFVAFGFFLNAAMPLVVVLLGVSRPVMNALTRAAVWILTRLRIVKNREAAQAKVDHLIGEYQGSVTALFKKPALAAKMLLLSLIQIAALMTMIVGVYHAFWLKGVPALTLVTLQALLYISASFMPLPGASGAQEYGFTLFFDSIFPGSMMISAIFVWRFMTYYLLLLGGFVAVVAEGGMRFIEGEQKEKKSDGTP